MLTLEGESFPLTGPVPGSDGCCLMVTPWAERARSSWEQNGRRTRRRSPDGARDATDGERFVLPLRETPTPLPPDYAMRQAAGNTDFKMNYRYIGVPDEDRGKIIAKSMPDIFRCFSEHSKNSVQ